LIVFSSFWKTSAMNIDQGGGLMDFL
jgi:hypothetical protein